MDKIIVYVDDADHAQQLLAPLAAKEPAQPALLGAGGLCAAHDAPRQQMGEPQRPRKLAQQMG